MPQVTQTVTDAAGAPVPGVEVIVRVWAGTNDPAPAYVLTPSPLSILHPARVVTDEDGQWTLTLPGNDAITPAGTVYQAIARVANRSAVSTFTLPSTGGPYTVEERLVPA